MTVNPTPLSHAAERCRRCGVTVVACACPDGQHAPAEVLCRPCEKAARPAEAPERGRAG